MLIELDLLINILMILVVLTYSGAQIVDALRWRRIYQQKTAILLTRREASSTL